MLNLISRLFKVVPPSVLLQVAGMALKAMRDRNDVDTHGADQFIREGATLSVADDVMQQLTEVTAERDRLVFENRQLNMLIKQSLHRQQEAEEERDNVAYALKVKSERLEALGF